MTCVGRRLCSARKELKPPIVSARMDDILPVRSRMTEICVQSAVPLVPAAELAALAVFSAFGAFPVFPLLPLLPLLPLFPVFPVVAVSGI